MSRHNYRRPLLLVIATGAALLTGCLRPAPVDTQHYLLPSATQAVVAPQQVRVSVAAYLDQGGLVLAQDHVRIHVAQQHRWGEPLGRQIQRGLSFHLQHYPDNDALMPIRVDVQGFHGNQQHQAVIDVGWQHADGQGQFRWRQPLQQDGYGALVLQLDQGLAALACHIRQTSGKHCDRAQKE